VVNESRDRTGRVVVAVGPGTSAEVVDAAFGLAAERGVPLLAVRTWHDPDLPLGGWLGAERIDRWDAVYRKTRRELDRALEPARAAHAEVDVATAVVDDDLVPFLAALSSRAHLLVLGRSTRLGHRPSPVDVLIRQAACPVLVVPPAHQQSSVPVRLPAARYARSSS
jgi:hypothetical protein